MRTASRFAALLVVLVAAGTAQAYDAQLRFRVNGPPGDKYTVTTGGFRHDGDPSWTLPSEDYEVVAGTWGPWVDAERWKLHERRNRAGGIAEWCTVKLSVTSAKGRAPVNGCKVDIQLATRPDLDHLITTLHETSGSNAVAFLLPVPLPEHRNEIETGSQMAARHRAWASAAAGTAAAPLSSGSPSAPALKRFDLITSIWGHYDPDLALEEGRALKLLGFNVLGGVPVDVLQKLDMRTYTSTWHLEADPEKSAREWKSGEGDALFKQRYMHNGRWLQEHTTHCVVTDEIQTLDFRTTDAAKLNAWFRDYLRAHDQTDATLGKPIEQIEYPAKTMYDPGLPAKADLTTRKIAYFAAKFGQWWTVKQLRQTTDLYKGSVPGGKTETLPADHAFFDAWGPPHVGMSARNLDLFEIGSQQGVDIISTEDWLGLNHMYGPDYTWTGAQSHEYLAAILRSGIAERPVALRSLITVSDDHYLRLKAFSALGQGVKSFFFWTYGPTFIGTENYWSDLRSEYEGIAHLTRDLARTEDVLYPARPVRDPVAILYSVSHDLWHTDNPAAFVETRLAWHALRHLSIQPDFLREEDVEAGRLGDYRVLYLADQNLARQAGAAIDQWVKAGGVLYLSAGAATRDQFNEPYLSPFAAAVWPDDAGAKLVNQPGHDFNERTDLPTIRALGEAHVAAEGNPGFTIKVLGGQSPLRAGLPAQTVLDAKFADGSAAGTVLPYGKGKIVAVGFMPGLAYAGFHLRQTTLDESWHPGPREVFALPLHLAGVHPVVQSSIPLVEASLLRGPTGVAIVLANYSYERQDSLRVKLSGSEFTGRPVSAEGAEVKVIPDTGAGGSMTIQLPIDWTDIIVIR